MKKIYLIGFMGAGKTTVGNLLSEQLKKSFVDVDIFIEEKYRKKITDIFKQYGEETFREMEAKALRDIVSDDKYEIIATGGGIVEREENVDLLKKGVVIYLLTSFEEISRRLQQDQNRPLWTQPKRKQKELFNRRHVMYQKIAHHTVTTTNFKIPEVVEKVKTICIKSL